MAAALAFTLQPGLHAQDLAGVVKPVPAANAQPVITTPVDNAKLVTLKQQPISAMKNAKDFGPADGNTVLGMELVLQRPRLVEQQLQLFTRQTMDPTNALFGKTLTPTQFAQRFGLAGSDLAAVTGWLQSQGFEVGNVDNGRLAIDFTGTVGQAETAFHTQIDDFTGADGEQHYANTTAVQIPKALAAVYAGLAGLQNFTAFQHKGFDGPVTDLTPGLASGPGSAELAEAGSPVAPKLTGEPLQDASFTASSYSILAGQATTLNVRVSGGNHPATGSVAITDETGKSVATISDISACSAYNGGYGRSCTLTFAPQGAGTSFLTATYSGNDYERGSVLGNAIISHAGTNVSSTVVTISTPMYWAGDSATITFTTVISYTGSVAPTGTYTVRIGSTTGTSLVGTLNLSSCTPTAADNLLTCTSTISATTLDADSAYGGNEIFAVYSGDANYAASNGYIYGYDATGAGTATPSLTVQGSFTATATYGSTQAESGVTGFTEIPASGNYNPGYTNCAAFVNFTGPAQLGDLGTYNGAGCSRTAGTSCALSFSSQPAFTLPAVVTPGTYSVTATYSGDRYSGTTGCVYNPVAATTALSVTINKQAPTITMTQPTAAAPTTQNYGSLAAFTVKGTLAWTGSGVAPSPANVTFTSTAAGSFGTVTCTAANSSTTFPTSPYTCSATFTPAVGDSPGSYNINMAFATDTNYSAVSTSVTSNYKISAAALTNLTLAASPTGSPTAGITATTLTATTTPAVAGLTVMFTDSTTGQSATATTNASGQASIQVPTSIAVSAGLNVGQASIAASSNSNAITSNTVNVYFAGLLVSVDDYHNFSGLGTVNGVTAEGTYDGSPVCNGSNGTAGSTCTAQYGIVITNFTSATQVVKVNFTNSTEDAFSYQTNCPVAGLAPNAQCNLAFYYNPPFGDGCNVATNCTKDSSGYPQGTFEEATWSVGSTTNGVITGIGTYTTGTGVSSSRSGATAFPADLVGKALLTTTSSVSATPLSLTFGPQAPGAVSATQDVTVTNNGTASAQLSYTLPQLFTVVNNCPAVLAPKASCQLQVTYSNTVVGTDTASITITPTGGSAIVISLTGQTANNNGLTLSSTAHNFGNVTDGTTSGFSFSVTNNSSTTASLSFSYAATTVYTGTTNCGTSLAAGASCTVSVTFAPTGPGNYSEALTVSSDHSILPGGTGSGPYSTVVNFTGAGVAGGYFTATSAGHNFGTVTVGSQASPYGVVLSNNTAVTLTLALGNLSANTDGYSVVTNCGSTLAVNASCNLQFYYTPTAVGQTTAFYQVSASNGSTSYPLYSGGTAVTSGGVTLTGTGQ
jgi:hypothetical protein